MGYPHPVEILSGQSLAFFAKAGIADAERGDFAGSCHTMAKGKPGPSLIRSRGLGASGENRDCRRSITTDVEASAMLASASCGARCDGF